MPLAFDREDLIDRGWVTAGGGGINSIVGGAVDAGARNSEAGGLGKSWREKSLLTLSDIGALL